MTEAETLSDEKIAEIKAKIDKLHPSSAMVMALSMVICPPNNLTPDQKRDVLMAGLEAYKTIVLHHMSETLLVGNPESDVLLGRVRYLLARSTQNVRSQVEKFFTLTEMVMPSSDEEKTEQAGG